MQNSFLFVFLISVSSFFGQNVKILKPILGTENIYSNVESTYWKNAIDSLRLSNNYENNINYSDLSEKTKKAIDSLEMSYGPLTQGVGCSWYCGGGPYKIDSSSILKNNENYSYNNIHDFDLLTGWVPKSKNGINETITFYFKPNSPRITSIIIYNGYIKNENLWKQNSRAKKIKVLINNIDFVILELEDTTASQKFDFEPIGNKKQDLILTFKILESYQGDKYNDLVITEINFDGIDVH